MSQAALNVRQRDAREKLPSGQSNGSRLAGIIFFFIVLGVIIGSGAVLLKWMNDASRLPLSKLVVTGQMHYTTDDDVRQAILSLGAPGTFMSQDVNVIQQQIERLPWVRQASVRKQWPDELKIHLVEYVPVAHWNDIHMVDAEGRAFSVPASRFGKEILPMLYGPEGSESDVLEGYHQMSEMLAASRFRLKSVAMSARRSWQLVLDDNIRLELGRSEDMKRLTRFIQLYPKLAQQAELGSERIGYVDLRYDAGAAVGWIAAAETATEKKS
ncbi:MAG: Cell division protein FtsQ [Candidatus Erwinia impunctatus]|nr:Cell division protein FtsQ [Culicoides impunctatus]